MARTGTIIGFETGHLISEGSYWNNVSASVTTPDIVGNVSLEGTIVRTGSGSLKVSPASGAAAYWRCLPLLAGMVARFVRFYVRVTVLPSTNARVLAGYTSAEINLLLNTNGTLQIRSGTTAVGSASTVALTDSTKWYRVELDLSGTTATLYIDGVNAASGATTKTNNIAVFGTLDTVADTYTAYFDDIVYDTAALPGAGAVVLLKPISDNARDTLWTGGSGATTNLFDAVNNIPPAGTNAESDTTQIEHAGGSGGTTDRYDANMTAYSTAGITASDTINGVSPFLVCGEDAGSGTKLLNFKILSNPATTVTNDFDVTGGTSGALDVFPTGWWVVRGEFGGAPTDLTSPVMRVVRPETATRVASVCFMGIYVDYTPSAFRPRPPAALDCLMVA